MKRSFLPVILLLLCFAARLSAQPYYLRGAAGPCGWGGNFTAACQLTDPDNDGIFTLTHNPNPFAPLGVQEFKIYDQHADAWWPGGANAWYNHTGGAITFRFIPGQNNRVQALDATNAICSPGAFSGWNNATPMTNVGGTTWCFTIPTPGDYEWKPTSCGQWASWQPNTGERSMNSGNWFVSTTQANEQVCVTYDPSTGQVIPPTFPVGIFLRGSAGPCGWGGVSPGCKMLDTDGDGCFELTVNLGAAPLGYQEFKAYNSAADQWFPGGSNAWYFHKGGSVTFKYCTATGEVEAHDNLDASICAPGIFNNWTNTAPMTGYDQNTWCFNIEAPGTYEWKPTQCGTWNSWQPVDGERSTGSDNWRVTTTLANQQVCVRYDTATGRIFLGPANVPTMSEWGLILFGLLVCCGGLVTVSQRRRILAGAQNERLSLGSMPFNKGLFARALVFAGAWLALVFIFAVGLFGYEMTNADLPGSLLAMPLLAYLLMLVADFGKK